MKRAVVASTVTLNGGDAAIARGALVFLRDLLNAEPAVVFLDDDAPVASRHQADLTFAPPLGGGRATSATSDQASYGTLDRLRNSRRRWAAHLMPRYKFGRMFATRDQREVVDLISSADLVAATGGTYLVDHYAWHVRLPDYEVAMRAGVPLLFLTQSMGLFERETKHTARLGRILEYAEVVMARDEPTVAAIQRVAPSSRVDKAPDLAFNLARHVDPIPKPPLSGRRLQIAVSVRQWRHFGSDRDPVSAMERYVRSIANVATRLITDLEAHVTFLSTCQGIEEYRYDDSEVAQQVVARLPTRVSNDVVIDRACHTPLDLIHRYGSFDVLLATRMHAAILGWIGGTPSVAIDYEGKIRELFGRHNLEELVHDMHDPDPSRLMDSVESVLAGSDTPSAARERADTEAKALARIARTLRLARSSWG